MVALSAVKQSVPNSGVCPSKGLMKAMVVSFKVLFSNVRFASFTTYICTQKQPHIMDIKRVPVSIYAEMTPNPKVMKFVSNKMLLQTDSTEFRNIEEAKPSPLATKLFHFPFVKEVFISGNYIAIAKFDVIEWDDVAQEVRVFITDFLQEGGVAVHEDQLKPAQTVETEADGSPAVRDEDLGEIEGRIVDILEEYIKPAVAQDGGNIAFMGYKDKIVEVQLQGACSGCPSSTMTLKNGILSILQKMLPTLVDDVVAVNG
jgi:Fe-S cluster biogenesis protein NfuA